MSRMVLKSPSEIAIMHEANLIIRRTLRDLSGVIRVGMTTDEIDAFAEERIRAEGGIPAFKGYPHRGDGNDFPGTACVSVNEEVVHGIPSDRVLQAGDIISIDTGCRVDGWCGDAAVTRPVGDIRPETQQLLDVTQQVLALAIELMAVKNLWSDVAAEMARFVGDHGFSTVECFVGHGIGREMHEEPQVPNFVNRSLRSSGDFRLEPGLVIAVEPMVNMGTKRVKILADHWTQVTQDGKPSAHFEHTIAMTTDGPQPLTVAPSKAESAQLDPAIWGT